MQMALVEQIRLAIDILKKGGIVAFPTDTVYGLGASIIQENTIRKIFLVKRRKYSVPLPIFLADIKQLNEAVFPVTRIANRLGKHFWPGAITIVGHKSPRIPDIITAGKDTIAVRIPRHTIPIALINGLGLPITGTSANVSGEPNTMTAQEVYHQLGNNVDFIIDDGIGCTKDIVSTIIDATTDVPRVIREGAVSTEEIFTVCASLAKEEY